MRSFLLFIKCTIKSFFKTAPLNIVFFIGLPIFITLIMGFVNDRSENPIEIEPTNISIEDFDNSEASIKLSEFLASDNFKDVFLITDNKEESYVNIVIPEDFQDSLINNEISNIKIQELKDEYIIVKTLEQVLQSYFDSYYSADILPVLSEKSISTEYIEPIIAKNSYAAQSASLIGYTISMIVMTFGAGNYASESLGLSKRILSTPKSNLQLFIESFISSIIQSFMLLMGYILFFRFLNISFTGSLPLLLLISVVCSFTITSMSTVINSFFDKKYGSVILNGLFLLHIAIGNVFFVSVSDLSNFSPLTALQKMFHNFVYTGTFESVQPSLIVTFIMGIVLFTLSLLKYTKFRREI